MRKRRFTNECAVKGCRGDARMSYTDDAGEHVNQICESHWEEYVNKNPQKRIPSWK